MLIALFIIISIICKDGLIAGGLSLLALLNYWDSKRALNERFINRDAVFFISLLCQVSLLFYYIIVINEMGSNYLHVDDSRLNDVLFFGFLYVKLFLLGGSKKRFFMEDNFIKNKRYSVNNIFILGLAPMVIITFIYFVFYRGGNYVDIHLSKPLWVDILLKSIYITYAVIIVLGYYFSGDKRALRKIYILVFLVVLVNFFLLKTRSPAIFSVLLLIFIRNPNVSYLRYGFIAFVFASILGVLAIWRDDSSMLEGNFDNLLWMVLSFGEFSHTLSFLMDYEDIYSFGYGRYWFGDDFMANKYAFEIAPDYYMNGGGFGFFIVSDFIANFGIFLGGIVFWVIAFLMNFINSKKSFFSYVLSCCLFASSLALVRNEFIPTLKGVIYILVISYVISRLLIAKKSIGYKMKILHVVPDISAEANGVTPVVEGLISKSRKYGFKTQIASLSVRRELQDEDFLECRKSIFFSGFGYSKDFFKYISLGHKDFDILHNHSLWSYSNFLVGLSSKSKAKLVVSPHGTLTKYALKRRFLLKNFLKPLQWKILERADLFHATAESEIEDIRSLGFKQDIALIPNFINVPEFNAHKVNTSKSKRLLFLSRIHPKKGLENLLEIWGLIQDDFLDWHLDIAGVGEDSYVEYLKRKSVDMSLKRIKWLGGVYGEDKNNIYRNSDIFVLPTFSENFGMVVLEALAQGCPVLVTKEAPWESLNKFNAGWCVENKKETILNTLVNIMKYDSKSLWDFGDRGFSYVKDNFSLESNSMKMIRSYDWILGKDSKPDFIF